MTHHQHPSHHHNRPLRGRETGFGPAEDPAGFGPGGFGPGGFGPGGFGPGGFGPGPGHHRRHGRGRRGQVRNAILAMLADQPRNGYQLMQSLAERTGGMWRPSPGAVYPALNQLEDEGLIEAFDNDGQRAFRLTQAGQSAAEELGETPWESLSAGLGGRDPATLRGLWQEVATLGGAAKELSRLGNDQQLGEATRIVAEARRRLYGLLAAEPEDLR